MSSLVSDIESSAFSTGRVRQNDPEVTMITSVRQWNPTALPRLLRRAMNAIKSSSVNAAEAKNATKQRGFFESYEKMMESQAILMLGIHNNHL